MSSGQLAQMFLPKQADINKIVELIQRRVLKGPHLPVTVNEMQAGY